MVREVCFKAFPCPFYISAPVSKNKLAIIVEEGQGTGYGRSQNRTRSMIYQVVENKKELSKNKRQMLFVRY